MTPISHERRISQSGFTLIETLAALVLMGLIVSVLATITSQWMPRWSFGLHRIQRSEAIGTALDRVSADIAASEYVPFDSQTKSVLFDGTETAVTLARASFGPNAGRGLDVVRIAGADDRKGLALTRSRATYAPGAEAAPNFSDPVVLLRAPYRVSFSYAGGDRTWKPSWHNSDKLPAAVLLTVRDAVSGRLLPISRIVAIHASAPAEAVCKQADGCDASDAAPLQAASRDTTIAEPGQ